MNDRKKIIGIVVLVLILLVILGLTRNNDGMQGVTGHAVKNLVAEDSDDDSDDKGKDEILLNGTSSDTDSGPEGGDPGQGDDTPDTHKPDPEPADEPEPKDEPEYECYRDTDCADDENCQNRKCVEPECREDSDCADDDPCTPDKCYFAGHRNAYCAGPTTETIPNDGCCPPGEWVDTDIDCPPVCGNRKCELGEGYATCKEDCPNTGGGDDDSGSSGGDEQEEPEYEYPE